MSDNVLQDLYDALQQVVRDIARESNAAGTPRVELTRPSDERFGDFTTNVALMLAPVVKERNPRLVAQQVVERASGLAGVASIEVAGPGFVNVKLDDAWFRSTLRAVLEAGDRFGSGVVGQPERVLLEFVSANPTGPLVAASARHAAYGDSLARLLRFAGHEVQTEFYVNDAGRQVELFGQSILARATGQPVPEGGYEGDYVVSLARELGAAEGDDPATLGKRAVDHVVSTMQPLLERLRVHFDRFQMETELHTGADGTSHVQDAIAELRSVGQTYDADGATFLRTTAFGDDKDRTIIRSNGLPTYFAADLGYMVHKYRRGYDRLLYVLGADHHGYVARLQAASAALGYDPDTCEVVIMQMVHLLEGGEQRKMSKRRGDFVAMQELLERIDVDAARWYLVERSHDATIELDLELAVEQSEKNPVWYVQYQHARICSILRTVADAAPELAALATGDQTVDFDALSEVTLDEAERRVIKRLAEFPVLVSDAAERRAPHKLPHYALELAREFSKFYNLCRVVSSEVEQVEPRVSEARIALCRATRAVLARSLDLIGVSAPEAM